MKEETKPSRAATTAPSFVVAVTRNQSGAEVDVEDAPAPAPAADNVEQQQPPVTPSRIHQFTESVRHAFLEKNVAVIEDLHNPTEGMDQFRFKMGLYKDYPLAERLIGGEKERDQALRKSGGKQINCVKSTDGWLRSMMTLESRALDVIWQGYSLVVLNAVLCTLLHELADTRFSDDLVENWNTVFSLVLTTGLAFLLVFRLNRIAIRFWEARGMWGDITKHSRSLVSMILAHCNHDERFRDLAIEWVGAYAIAVIHFIRNDDEIPPCELSGFLTRADIRKMEDSNHYALYAASRIRHALARAMKVTADTPVQVAHARTVQLSLMDVKINQLISQVSGMEKIRSTPLPTVYVTHLRTFLFLYQIFLPYIWVEKWGWATIPLMAFTAFALMAIEGASTECEVPFRKDRVNHLAMEGYCIVLLNNIQGLVVQAANMDMEETINEE